MSTMASKQRLTVASMWGFEDAGVHDIQNAFKKSNPAVECLCEYSKTDDIWVVKGSLDDARTAEFVQLIEKAIDDERETDLLDMPKIRQLEISTVHEVEEAGPIPAEPTVIREGQLLDGDSDEEIVVNSMSRVTKAWSSSFGGLGCFVQSNDYNHILDQIADATGTEIAVDERSGDLRVSGKNSGDVEDALAKLTRVEQPLSLAGNPRIGNIAIAYPINDTERFRIQNYGIINSIALPRVLADHRSPPLIELPMAFTTVLVEFDHDTQLFALTKNLREPPRVGTEPGVSRLWSDFSFREIGAKEKFMDTDSVVEKAAAQNDQSLVSVAAVHPYLTAEKANEVQKWVTEGTDPEPEGHMAAETEAVAAPPLPPPVAQSPNIPAVKRHPGIKIRRPKYLVTEAATMQASTTSAQNQALAAATVDQSQKCNNDNIQAQRVSDGPATSDQPDASSAVPVRSDSASPSRDRSTKDESAGKSNEESSPRKKWRMTYKPEPCNVTVAGTPGMVTTQALEKDVALPGEMGSIQPLRTRPQTPGSKFRLPPGFHVDSYGHKKSPTKAVKRGRAQAACKAAGGAGIRTSMRSTPKKRDAFVDLLEPVAPVKSHAHLALSFDQPALIPEKSSVLSDSQNASVCRDERDKTSVDERTSEGRGVDTASAGASFESSREAELSDPGDLERQRERLALVKKQLDAQRQEMAREEALTLNRPGISKYNTLIKERLAQLERTVDFSEKQAVDETASRVFRRTMLHRMGKPTPQAKGKSVAKAQRQATLEDAWGLPSKSAGSGQKLKVDTSKTEAELHDSIETGDANASKAGSVKSPSENNPASEYMNSCIKSIFEHLEPAIEAAEYYPGSLTLEVHLGLVLIPLLPKTHLDGLITLNDWIKIFQPRNGLCAPSTMFFSRLTSSGTDIDFIVDLKTSKAEGRSRLFDQEFTDYSVTYEYHFRTKSDQLLIVVIDEDGTFTLQRPPSTLAQFNMHFPKHTWDASVVLSGTTPIIPGSDEETAAVNSLVDNLWLQTNKGGVKIFTKLPKRSGLTIEKVLLRRWTRHRYLGSHSSKPHMQDEDSVLNPSTPTPVEPSLSTASNFNDCSTAPDREASSPANDDGTGESVYLRVTEIQDLFIGISNSDTQIIRARSASPMEMAKAARLWYEVPLVSPAIETVLKANSDVEIGERSEDWCSIDLLGADAGLMATDCPTDAAEEDRGKTPLSAVATKIGNAGLGELLRVAKTVVEKIDAVGYYNRGPVPALSALPLTDPHAAAGITAPMVSGGGGVLGLVVKSNHEQAMVASSLGGLARAAAPPRSFGFHDLASVKAVNESASQIGHRAAKASVAAVTHKEEAELAYW